jgi:hypothetical protein
MGRTSKSERAEDMTNVEAWAGVFDDILRIVPEEIRADVVALAGRNEEAERKRPKLFTAAELKNMALPGAGHQDAIARLESLIVQVLVRHITNDHSPEEAAKILFADHPYGDGSGSLIDYLEGLPSDADSELAEA